MGRLLLDTDMMTLFNRIDNGLIKTHKQFNTEIGKMATTYGMEVTGQSYTSMLKHCNPKAQIKIEKLASGRK